MAWHKKAVSESRLVQYYWGRFCRACGRCDGALWECHGQYVGDTSVFSAAVMLRPPVHTQSHDLKLQSVKEQRALMIPQFAVWDLLLKYLFFT